MGLTLTCSVLDGSAGDDGDVTPAVGATVKNEAADDAKPSTTTTGHLTLGHHVDSVYLLSTLMLTHLLRHEIKHDCPVTIDTTGGYLVHLTSFSVHRETHLHPGQAGRSRDAC